MDQSTTLSVNDAMHSRQQPVLTSQEMAFVVSNYEKVSNSDDSSDIQTFIGSNPRAFWRAVTQPNKQAVHFMLALHLILGIVYTILFLVIAYRFMCAVSAGDARDSEIVEFLFPTTYLKHVGVGKQEAVGRLAESHIALMVSAVLVVAAIYHFWCAFNHKTNYSSHLRGYPTIGTQLLFAMEFAIVSTVLIYVIASLAGVRDVHALNAIIVVNLLGCFFAIMGYFKGCPISVIGTSLCVFYIIWTIATSLYTQMKYVIPSDVSLQWITTTTVLALVLYGCMFAIFACKPLFPQWLPSPGAHELAVVLSITIFTIVISISLAYDFGVRFHAFKMGRALAVN